MVTLLSRYVNNLRKDRRAERSAARQTLRPPQRALAAIPKRSLVICTPPDARGSILRDCNHLWRVRSHGETGANKGSICRYNMLDSLLKASPLRAQERGPFTRVRGRSVLRNSPWRHSGTRLASGAPRQRVCLYSSVTVPTPKGGAMPQTISPGFLKLLREP